MAHAGGVGGGWGGLGGLGGTPPPQGDVKNSGILSRLQDFCIFWGMRSGYVEKSLVSTLVTLFLLSASSCVVSGTRSDTAELWTKSSKRATYGEMSI